jgi:hypothetical protein
VRFFGGIFEILLCFVVVICGEVVVKCVVNVVCWMTLFARFKLRHLFQLYFSAGKWEDAHPSQVVAHHPVFQVKPRQAPQLRFPSLRSLGDALIGVDRAKSVPS